MKMKMSLSTSSVNPLNAENAFKAAHLAGYSGVELMVSPSRDTQDADHIKSLIDKYELPVTSVHAPTLLLCKFVWGTDPEQKLIKSVEMAEKIGAGSVVVHPPFKRNSHSVDFLQSVKNLNDNSYVDVAVENMFPWIVKGYEVDMYGPSWEETCETADNLTFDFSHAALSGMDVMGFFRKYHQKVRIIHFTDGSARLKEKGDSIKDEHMLPGEGDMPLAEVYAFLKEKRWLGETVLEINTRKSKTLAEKMPALNHSIDYFNEITQ